MEIALDHANKAHNQGKKAMKRTHMQLGDVNADIDEDRKIKNEVFEAYGLTERKVNAMNGELEESKVEGLFALYINMSLTIWSKAPLN